MEKKNIFKKIDELYTKSVKVIIGDIPADEEQTISTKKVQAKTVTETEPKNKTTVFKDTFLNIKSKILNFGKVDEKALLYKEVVKREKQEAKEAKKLAKAKTASTKTIAKKTVDKKLASKKATTTKKATTSKTKSETKKVASKQTVTKKTTPKKPASSAAKKTVEKKPTTKKSTTTSKVSSSKTSPKRPVTKATTSKTETVKKVAAVKASTKKSVSKTMPKKKETSTDTKTTAATKKATSTKTTKAPAKKVATKKTPIKKAVSKTKSTTKATSTLSKRDVKIAFYAKDITKHYGEVDNDLLTLIVKNLGPSIYKKDAELVSCSDPKELDTVRRNFLVKKLGIEASQGVLDAAIQDVCTELKGVRSKYRATFYYSLTKKFKKESTLS